MSLTLPLSLQQIADQLTSIRPVRDVGSNHSVNVNFSGWEHGDLTEFIDKSGGEIVTNIVNSGARSFRAYGNGQDAAYCGLAGWTYKSGDYFGQPVDMDTEQMDATFAFRIATGAEEMFFCTIWSLHPEAPLFELRLRAGPGGIWYTDLYGAGSATPSAQGTFSLVENVWYTISVHYRLASWANGSWLGQVDVYINRAQVISKRINMATAPITTRMKFNRTYVGNLFIRQANPFSFYFDDFELGLNPGGTSGVGCLLAKPDRAGTLCSLIGAAANVADVPTDVGTYVSTPTWPEYALGLYGFEDKTPTDWNLKDVIAFKISTGVKQSSSIGWWYTQIYSINNQLPIGYFDGVNVMATDNFTWTSILWTEDPFTGEALTWDYMTKLIAGIGTWHSFHWLGEGRMSDLYLEILYLDRTDLRTLDPAK